MLREHRIIKLLIPSRSEYMFLLDGIPESLSDSSALHNSKKCSVYSEYFCSISTRAVTEKVCIVMQSRGISFAVYQRSLQSFEGLIRRRCAERNCISELK